ncbi:ACT domain-containing protein [Actinomycetospora termitidis]|uniref:ACT domain-containing protein n=1 Tax=Actinomycetospora termitidis TaxID=3053470 RepID=A0ABT7MD86_9PSEU|nr:ACT domain-containing protein [Actinomycetospora sp. Odt1-22]MDL5158613.1 ACT domain-containing protein [Actinomycetospora sp. Odt1-22]
MTELPALLADMSPRLREGRYVFSVLPDGGPVPADAVVTVTEDEGRTAVVPWPGPEGAEYDCAWITLEVHSSLSAVGFLAVVCSALAEAGMSVNPVSGFHHDHLFVPWEDREAAMGVLRGLVTCQRAGTGGSSGP